MVADVWKLKVAERVDQKAQIEKSIRRIEDEQSSLVTLIARAKDYKVIDTYEKRISLLAEEEGALRTSLMSVIEHRKDIGTALDIVFDFLQNPLEQWVNGDIHRKKLVLKLVFEANLAYSRNDGFETAILSLPLRVFTLPEAQKSLLVEVGRIELPSESVFENESTTRSSGCPLTRRSDRV